MTIFEKRGEAFLRLEQKAPGLFLITVVAGGLLTVILVDKFCHTFVHGAVFYRKIIVTAVVFKKVP